jgi:hypothetical protein
MQYAVALMTCLYFREMNYIYPYAVLQIDCTTSGIHNLAQATGEVALLLYN